MSDEMVVVKVFSSENAAMIAKGHLENEGIRVLIRKDDAGGMLPPLQQSLGVKLLVDKKNVDKAENILNEKSP
jgi:hypothetical protein